MALPTSGPLSLNQIHVEAGNSSGTTSSLNSSSIRVLLNPDKGVNQTNSISEYRGASRDVSFTYELIGGGGAGGVGFEFGGGDGTRSYSGSSTTISGGGFSASSSGAVGGRHGHIAWNVQTGRGGAASAYGAGGGNPGTPNGVAGAAAPSSSYGAGGAGGGGDSPDGYPNNDSAGSAGEGGSAASKSTGSGTVVYGTTLTITIGSGGPQYTWQQLASDNSSLNAGGAKGGSHGGAGAGGYAKITYKGVDYPFTSNGTLTLT